MRDGLLDRLTTTIVSAHSRQPRSSPHKELSSSVGVVATIPTRLICPQHFLTMHSNRPKIAVIAAPMTLGQVLPSTAENLSSGTSSTSLFHSAHAFVCQFLEHFVLGDKRRRENSQLPPWRTSVAEI